MDNKKITSENYDEMKENNHQKVNQDKKTKDKSKAQKAVPILIVAVVSLVIILTCVLIAYYQIYNSGKQNGFTGSGRKSGSASRGTCIGND